MNCKRLGILVIALMLWPTGAYAAAGWWAWLEELSGPGPFHGWGLSTPVLCTSDGDIVSCRSRSESRRPKRLVVLGIARLGSGDNLRFKDERNPGDRREVHLTQVSGSYLFRLHPAVDVGAGAGMMRFSGEGFEPLWKVTLVPV